MGSFLAENWVAIASMAVALSGGIPGITSVIQHLQRRPRLKADLAGLVTGTMVAPGETDRAMVFLTLTLANDGDRAITPACFDLEVKRDGQWVPLQRMLVPEAPMFESDEYHFELENPSARDLQRTASSIGRGLPLYGHLMFNSGELDQHAVRSSSAFRLTCHDVVGTTHRCQIDLQLNPTGAGVAYPKHGLTVRSRPPAPQ